jgi:Raf kinase inhibitor-like YbhB/YbcL family protein
LNSPFRDKPKKFILARMELRSNTFLPGGKIPSRYTCEGAGAHPHLSWNHVPDETKSFVLIMDDPDVPSFVRKDCMYDHWVLFNIPKEVRVIEEGQSPPGIYGKNTSGANGYIGPCPPDREHRYFFKLYALDTLLKLPLGSSKKEVEKAMEGHILGKGELMGRYEKTC